MFRRSFLPTSSGLMLIQSSAMFKNRPLRMPALTLKYNQMHTCNFTATKWFISLRRMDNVTTFKQPMISECVVHEACLVLFKKYMKQTRNRRALFYQIFLISYNLDKILVMRGEFCFDYVKLKISFGRFSQDKISYKIRCMYRSTEFFFMLLIFK